MKIEEYKNTNHRSKKNYSQIHFWIRYYYGKANHCEFNMSHKSKKYEWANIDGIYENDIKHFIQLCQSCHRKLDWTDEARAKMAIISSKTRNAKKKIKQLSLSGEIIKIWGCGMDVQRQLGILRSNIGNVLAGKSKTAGGWRWSL